MTHNIWVYMCIMAGTIYLIRALPLALIRRRIQSPFIRSFLYYVPYVTLAVMTFPAIWSATGSVGSGVAALAVGVVLAWRGAGLLTVSVTACAAVFLLELFL